VQYQDGIKTPAEPIGHERDVAQDADDPQRDHRLHVEGQKDQRRGQVAGQLDPIDPHGILLRAEEAKVENHDSTALPPCP
jgi:hypothetical protein